MGLFKSWKKQEVQEKAAFSPVSGELVPLETVSDAVFAEKSLGDGVAVIPTDGSLYAPNTFSHRIHKGEKATIGISGDNKSTRLLRSILGLAVLV